MINWNVSYSLWVIISMIVYKCNLVKKNVVFTNVKY